MRRAMVVFLIAIGVVATGIVPMASPAAADAGAEADFVTRLNRYRASNGLGALTTHSELVSVARRWSGRMAGDNRLSHNANLPNEVTADWEKLAENVGVGPTVEEIHDAFVNSSSHRVNMVEAAFTHIGVGVVVGADGKLWVTHIFMRLGSGGEPAPAPRKAAPPPTTTTVRPATAAPAPAAPRPRPAAATGPSVGPPAAEPGLAAAIPAVPAPAVPTPTARLVLVLDALRSLDQGR